MERLSRGALGVPSRSLSLCLSPPFLLFQLLGLGITTLSAPPLSQTLRPDHLLVDPSTPDQLLVPALLHNPPLVKYQDAVCVLDRRQTVRHHNGRPLARRRRDGLLDLGLGVRI
jgi:hypothetical protein